MLPPWSLITREPDAPVLVQRIEEALEPITSPMAIYETAMAVRRKLGGGAKAAKSDLDAFLALAGISVVAITPDDADRALAAHERYGRGTGHPARLNMGDCFAYAVAEGRRVPLLYKGDDFARTDLA